MIEKIEHYSLTSPASIYDEEALTALELAGRTAGKVNECVGEVNKIPDKVTGEFEKNLEDGTFDEMLDQYAGDVLKRVENILGGIPENPTAMDAEVVDLRLGQDGKTYPNAGDAIRAQFAKALVVRQATVNNIDEIVDPGYYYLSSSGTWTGTFPSKGYSVGVLMVLTDPINTTRKAQIFVSFDNYLSTRIYNSGAFTPWETVSKGTDFGKFMRFVAPDANQLIDVDELTDFGCYMFGSSHNVTGAPSKLGMLLVYKGLADYNVYQLWHDYYNGRVYTRNYIYNQGFTPWSGLATEDDLASIPTGANNLYKVQKVNTTDVYVEQIGKKGNVRFLFHKNTNTVTGESGFGIRGINLVKGGSVVKTILSSGMDIDGVIQWADGSHSGGVHGSEVLSTEPTFYVNGSEYSLETLPSGSMFADQVLIKSAVNVYKMGDFDLNNPYYSTIKHAWLFNDEGLNVMNVFGCGGLLPDIKHARGCMMSVDKSVFTQFVTRSPIENPEVYGKRTETTEGDLTYLLLVADGVEFIGSDVCITQEALSYFRDAENVHVQLVDYGTRYKTYFDHVWGNDDDEIHTHNLIKITY